MKMTRRDMVKWAGVAPAIAASPALARAAEGAPAIDLMLLDERFALTVADADITAPVARFSGDVTRLWTSQLDAAFRGTGFVLGGITGSDALFVLEVLANHHGRRVVSQRVLGAADARGVNPVSWVIAPHHPSKLA
jgi:hypothetical protein